MRSAGHSHSSIRAGRRADAAVHIVSDGGAARGRLDPKRVRATLAVLRRLRAVTQNIAWLNPTPPERWPGTTAGEIAESGAIPMFSLTRDGLNAAVDVLRGRLPSRSMRDHKR